MEHGLVEKLVLLVEDEDALRRGMKTWLRNNEHGFAVMVTSNGDRALRLIDRHKPNLVISDLRLPGMDGLELLLACRKSHPQLRFVVMSAYGTPDLEERSRLYGAVRFLHKPIDLSVLESTIVEVLNQDPTTRKAGCIHGISVTGFIQLLSVERKTVALNVAAKDGTKGVLYLHDGSLVHAVWGQTQGVEAAMQLFMLEDVDMWLDTNAVGAPHKSITINLAALIMQALQRKDESDR